MGSREKFLITLTPTQNVLSEKGYVIHFDLRADHKKTDLKEYWTLAPKINESISGIGLMAGGQVIVGEGEAKFLAPAG